VFRTGVLLWVSTRVAYALVVIVGAEIVGLMSPEEALRSALHPVWSSRLLLVALTAGLVHLDRKLAHERLLQANFGVSTAWFVATSLVAAGLSDIGVQALMRII
jgi:hypothetical protein